MIITILFAGIMGCITEGPEPQEDIPPGFGKVTMALKNLPEEVDIAVVRVDVTSQATGEIYTEMATVQDGFRADWMPENETEHEFAAVAFVLPVGLYDIVATPLTETGEESDICDVTNTETVEVEDGVTTEVPLVSQCHFDDTGMIDVSVFFNFATIITNIAFDPDLYLSTCETLTMAAEVYDADLDPVNYEWTITDGPEDAVYNIDANSNYADFVAEISGEYTMLLTVDDGEGGADTMEFHIRVSPGGCLNAPSDQWVETEENTLTDIIFGESNPDSRNLEFVLLSGPEHGTIEVEDREITYIPESGYIGDDEINFALKNDFDITEVATMAITVIPILNLPDTSDYEVIEVTGCGVLDQPHTVYQLVNDIVADGDCFDIQADDIVLDGAEFTLVGSTEGETTGIMARGRNQVVVQNIHIEGFWRPIHLYETSNSVVANCEIEGSTQYGLNVWPRSNNNLIYGCNIHDLVHQGIMISSSSRGNIVARNRVSNVNSTGIHMYDESADNMIIANLSEDNVRGVGCDRCHRSKVIGNILRNNSRDGLGYVYNCSNNYSANNLNIQFYPSAP